MSRFNDPLSPDPEEDWRLRMEKKGYGPFLEYKGSAGQVSLRRDMYAQLTSVYIWRAPGRRFAVRLVGDQFEADGTPSCPYRAEIFYDGWIRFRKAMKAWGYTPPFFWWQSWPEQPLG